MKKLWFFIDDNIWLFRDLTWKNYKSAFEHPYLALLKKAHDEFGLKTQLNCFYRTSFFYGKDEFCLADMTDKFKLEFEENSDWLKFGFHSMEEWPDYPYVNADYDLMYDNLSRAKKEIIRFAGENAFAKSFVPHWCPLSKEGCQAVKDLGIDVIYSTFGEKGGDVKRLPYGHEFRLIHNKKPETGVYLKKCPDNDLDALLYSYNHVTEGQYKTIEGKWNTVLDPMGVHFIKEEDYCLNYNPIENHLKDFEGFCDQEFVIVCTHEQYFYPDYFAYQPEYEIKILQMAEYFKNKNYEFVFVEDITKR